MIDKCIWLKDVLYLPSGRVFLSELADGYLIESTEMRDISIDGKEHFEVRKSLDPRVIWKHIVDYRDKWLLTVSTQRGCSYDCQFCDVAPLSFSGNLTTSEILAQVQMLLDNTPHLLRSDKVKIGFARMGEPSQNLNNVMDAIEGLPSLSAMANKDFKWLPCFNTILPQKVAGYDCYGVIDRVIGMKERFYDGFLHFQISCNSTDEVWRQKLFGGADVMPIKEIIKYINKLYISNRTITLNFIVIDGIEIDVQKLKSYGLSGDKFAVKLIPLNETINGELNKLGVYANYENYDKLTALGEEFNRIGVPTVVDAIAKCEEAGLCCGQLAQIYR